VEFEGIDNSPADSALDAREYSIETEQDCPVAIVWPEHESLVAVNNGGSAFSNEISVTSAEVIAPNIVLSASGYKSKGWQYVDASWDAGGAAVVLYRNNAVVYSGSASATTDGRIAKGGAVYDYQLCPQGQAQGSDSCSDVVRIVF